MTVICMPYFIYKGFNTINLNKLKGSEKYLIENYLNSKLLEDALGSYIGILYLLYGIYNLFFAVYVHFYYQISQNYVFEKIFKIQIYSELFVFAFFMVFGIFVIFKKVSGVYYGFFNLDRLYKKKLVI